MGRGALGYPGDFSTGTGGVGDEEADYVGDVFVREARVLLPQSSGVDYILRRYGPSAARPGGGRGTVHQPGCVGCDSSSRSICNDGGRPRQPRARPPPPSHFALIPSSRQLQPRAPDHVTRSERGATEQPTRRPGGRRVRALGRDRGGSCVAPRRVAQQEGSAVRRLNARPWIRAAGWVFIPASTPPEGTAFGRSGQNDSLTVAGIRCRKSKSDGGASEGLDRSSRPEVERSQMRTARQVHGTGIDKQKNLGEPPPLVAAGTRFLPRTGYQVSAALSSKRSPPLARWVPGGGWEPPNLGQLVPQSREHGEEEPQAGVQATAYRLLESGETTAPQADDLCRAPSPSQ